MTITPKRFGAVLQHVFILSVSVASAGCEGSAFDDIGPVPCTPTGKTDYLSGLALTEPADYLELRRRPPVSEPEVGDTVVNFKGSRCAKASNVAACEAAIAAANTDSGFPLNECVDTCINHYLVVNRGQDVVVVDSTDKLRELFGPINSHAEAVLIVSTEGYTIECRNPTVGGVREVSGKYEVIGIRTGESCDFDGNARYLLEVTSDGEVTLLQKEDLSGSFDCFSRRPAGLGDATQRVALPRRETRARWPRGT